MHKVIIKKKIIISIFRPTYIVKRKYVSLTEQSWSHTFSVKLKREKDMISMKLVTT